MKTLYYDCFAGISGDMNLGAMIELGVSFEELKRQLSLLGLDDEFEITLEKGEKQGITGSKVTVVDKNNRDHNHGHHDHNHVHQRDYGAIKQLIVESPLAVGVKEKAIAIFEEVAQAEAKVHGRTVEDVHFHEVGAIDSIVDVVGAAICFELLGIDRVCVSDVEVGSGFVKCAHGFMPVPAPATAEILKGLPIVSRVDRFEMTTPTGAAILKGMGALHTDDKQFVIEKIGYGLGTWSLEIPNVLRAMVITEKKKNRFSGL